MKALNLGDQLFILINAPVKAYVNQCSDHVTLVWSCHSHFTWRPGVVFSFFEILRSLLFFRKWLSQSVFSLQKWVSTFPSTILNNCYINHINIFKLTLLLSSLHTYWLQKTFSIHMFLEHKRSSSWCAKFKQGRLENKMSELGSGVHTE